ncbi:hypothetical protein TTHERM_000581869 (macronuclear) [Tetrahymena thermophila SB210]|uniref:Transmembrane protein n=1 Tax=Tetrahymena thermophila (strain SB210) TaxID=312017 RepID=W7XIW2_TETTS|nr:hypothetical protein TTHERM_000581869 [Tetrahymena thermophila SB210]EWS73654.1 hypothetical protein TTHERM_000581869 [Tetrahymena thermophila SB210]|eukprot:XP_012653784.1 hypothetical protein TTHERM_000581869 [Tetrahymena thermophila SB210]
MQKIKSFTVLILLTFQLIKGTQICKLNLICSEQDFSCLFQLSMLNTCISSQCDQFIQDSRAQSECYLQTCKPKFYQQNDIQVQKYFDCLANQEIEQKNQLQPFLFISNNNSPKFCFEQLVTSCQNLSNDCINTLQKQIECINTNCQNNMNTAQEFQQCMFITCKTDNPDLDTMQNNMIQCMFNSQQPQTGHQNTYEQCFSQFQTNCQSFSDQCPQVFKEQQYCIKEKCVPDPTTAQDLKKCLLITCKTDFEDLDRLETQMIECVIGHPIKDSSSFLYNMISISLLVYLGLLL